MTLSGAVAERLSRSNLTLEQLQAATGIHRAKLGRIRLGRCEVTPDEAQLIYRALTASQN